MELKKLLDELESWQSTVLDAEKNMSPGGDFVDEEAHRVAHLATHLANSGNFHQVLSILRELLPAEGIPYRITVEMFENEAKKPMHVRHVYMPKPGGHLHLSHARPGTALRKVGRDKPIGWRLSEETLVIQAVLDPKARDDYFEDVEEAKPATD
jgi:hypothetical protein